MRVLVVDDSVVFRAAIKQALMGSGYVSEVDIASNGKIAIAKLQQGTYDGITLDIEMPIMDGIEAVEEIRKFNKDIPIIIFSSQNLNSAKKTIAALGKGANDFVAKVQGSNDINENLKMIESQLVPRFKAMLKNVTAKPAPQKMPPRHISGVLDKFHANLICISSSTGGPDMLMKVFAGLKKLRVPILLVQHMPPIFTTQLAAALDRIGQNSVVEAKEGDMLEPGVCYLAPGDFHMECIKHEEGKYTIHLQQEEKVCFVRPSADVTLTSVAKNFSGFVGSFIFTGMGYDGAAGSKLIKDNKGIVVIQDEESSVVWGMPGAVFEANIHDEVLTPEEMINAINKIAS